MLDTGEFARSTFRKCRAVARSTACKLVLRLGRRLDRTAEDGRLECPCPGEEVVALGEKEKLCSEFDECDPASLPAPAWWLVVEARVSGCCGGSIDPKCGCVKRDSSSSSLRSRLMVDMLVFVFVLVFVASSWPPSVALLLFRELLFLCPQFTRGIATRGYLAPSRVGILLLRLRFNNSNLNAHNVYKRYRSDLANATQSFHMQETAPINDTRHDPKNTTTISMAVTIDTHYRFAASLAIASNAWWWSSFQWLNGLNWNGMIGWRK